MDGSTERHAPLDSRGVSPPAIFARARAYAPLAVVLLLYVVLSARMFRLISHHAVNILFGDAWGFDYYLLSGQHSWWQMFSWQFGPHRQGVGAIFLYWIGEWSHWNSRTEAFAAGAVIVCAVAVALVLRRRLYGQITYQDALIPLLLLVPSQFEMLTWGPNVSHGPFPLFLLVLYCLAWGVRFPIPKYGFVLFLNFCLIYTGFGLFIGFITPLLLGYDFYKKLRGQPLRERLYALIAFCLSLASLGSFFAGYKVEHGVLCYGLPNTPAVSFKVRFLPEYTRFMCLMFANFFGIKGTNLWTSLSGGLILAAAIICLGLSLKRFFLSRSAPCAAVAVPAILLGFCLLFAFFTALGRLCLGFEAAQVARYMPYLSVGLLGIYFSLLFGPMTKARSISIYALFAFAAFTSISIRGGTMIWLGQAKREWKACYLEHRNSDLCDKLTKFRVDFDPDSKARQEKLDVLEQKRLNLFASPD